MIIAINGYHLKNNLTGIGNFMLNALHEMSLRKDFSITLYCNPHISDRILSLLPKNINVVKTNKKDNELKWLGVTLPSLVNRYKPDIFWSPSPISPFFISKNIKTMITVHDFVSVDFPKTMTLKGRMIMKFLLPYNIKNADYLWTVSEFTKQRLIDRYSLRRQKNIFVGAGVGVFFKNVQAYYVSRDYITSKFHITKPYLVFVGTKEPRKNISFLLKLFKVLHDKYNMQLVICGDIGWGNTGIDEVLDSQGYPKYDVIFTGFVDNEDIVNLYRYAKCYISTAFYEGLGLPQLEAMSCSCPVISPHNSAMIEVVDGAGICVKGWAYEDWLTAINQVLTHREEIIKRQNNRLANYDWSLIINSLEQYLGGNLIENFTDK